MIYTIKNKETKKIICEGEAETLKEFIEKAVKKGVNLSWANLKGTKLFGVKDMYKK